MNLFKLIAVSLLCYGCAYFQSGKIPKPEFQNREHIKKRSITVSPKFYMLERVKGHKIGRKKRSFFKPHRKSPLIMPFYDSNYFDSVIVSSDEVNGDTDLLIRLNVSREERYTGMPDYMWFMSYCFTVGIIPYWSTGKIIIEAEVLDKRGELLKKYRLEDDTLFRGHLLLLPVALYKHASGVFNETGYNLISYLIQKMDEDNLLKK